MSLTRNAAGVGTLSVPGVMRATRARRFLLGGLAVLGVLAMAAPARADVVTDWNATAASALASPGTAIPPGAGQGAIGAVNLAMVHGAVYDAVNAIAGGHEPYVSSPSAEPWYSQEAAVAAAARHVLLNGGLNGAGRVRTRAHHARSRRPT